MQHWQKPVHLLKNGTFDYCGFLLHSGALVFLQPIFYYPLLSGSTHKISIMNNSSSVIKNCEQKSAPASAWIMLALAICFEIAGAIGLRFSEGFSLLLPTMLALAAFTLALYLVSHVMKKLPVSIAYPMWAGGGTAGVAIVGFFILNESMDTLKLTGIILIIIGVVMINRVSEKTSGC